METTQLIVNKRKITFCPFILKYVTHEITFLKMKGQEDIITTCTGIEDRCANCSLLSPYQHKTSN
jgi:hypothetical protein